RVPEAEGAHTAYSQGMRLRNKTQAAKVNARELRRKMSLPEVLLWKAIKGDAIGFHVRRQHPLGSYTLDFFLPEALLCVEVDGLAHQLRVEHDVERDRAVDALGIRTVRFAASAVLGNAGDVAYAIHVIACERV